MSMYNSDWIRQRSFVCTENLLLCRPVTEICVTQVKHCTTLDGVGSVFHRTAQQYLLYSPCSVARPNSTYYRVRVPPHGPTVPTVQSVFRRTAQQYLLYSPCSAARPSSTYCTVRVPPPGPTVPTIQSVFCRPAQQYLLYRNHKFSQKTHK
jgi:hypothetical protein